jgi:hypothetical protein
VTRRIGRATLGVLLDDDLHAPKLPPARDGIEDSFLGKGFLTIGGLFGTIS